MNHSGPTPHFKKTQNNQTHAQQTNKDMNSLCELSPAHPQSNRYSTDFPTSIEKQRYLEVCENNFFQDIFYTNRCYSKDQSKKDQFQAKQQRKILPNIYDIKSEDSSEAISSHKNKKCSETVFTPYDLSFQDRISLQTMDSKQFSASFEFEDKQPFGNFKETNRQPDPKKANPKKDKDYFDSFIVQDDEEQRQQKQKKQENHKQSYVSENQPMEIIQIENSKKPHLSFYFVEFPSSLDGRKQNYDELQLKYILSEKKQQLLELTSAYDETSEQNKILRQRVQELETHLRKTVENKRKKKNYPNIFSKQTFQETIKVMRKHSL